MNNKTAIWVVIGLLAATVAGFLVARHLVDEDLPFEDVDITDTASFLDELTAGYIVIPTLSAEPDAVQDLVGAIAIRTLDENDKWHYEMRYRPANDALSTKLVDERIFNGTVSANAAANAKFKLIDGTAGADELAVTEIKNILRVGYKDRTDIPFDKLDELSLEANKEYYFIQGVTVTSVSTRRFRKYEGGGKISGLALGAMGSLYYEHDAAQTRRHVSFIPFKLSHLHEGEAGTDSIAQLKQKARTQRLSDTEAQALTEFLLETAAKSSPVSAQLDKPAPPLPVPLSQMEPLIWYEDLIAVKQSSPNRCWAAAAAMLMGWEKKRYVSEQEAATALGGFWLSKYQNNDRLISSHKIDLIEAAGFTFDGPKTYYGEGLASLLQEVGPAWFTIDRDFGSHAVVVTGVFRSPVDESLWVAYLDPSTGRLESDRFFSFINRYQEPVFRANEAQSVPDMTLRGAQIQVIHIRS